MVFAETMPGRELYIIQKGSVKITKIVNDNEVLLAVLKQGDIFGEMALIEDKPRSASAIAFEDSVLLAVNKDNFSRMVTSQPQIIAKLTQHLAERIWFIYKQLANTLLTDKVGRLYDMLLIQLERARVPIRAGEAYTFDFGTRELINMVGLPTNEGQQAVRELLHNTKLKAMENRIYCSDVEEIEKQAKYYRKMQRIEKTRKDQRRIS
jgi:CRP-like cAMP-binding protein